MRFVVVATTKKNEEYPTRLFWLTKAKALQSKAKQMKEANLFCTFRAAVTNKSFPIADAVIRLEAEDCQWPMPVRRSLSRSMYVLFLLKLKEKTASSNRPLKIRIFMYFLFISLVFPMFGYGSALPVIKLRIPV